MGHTADKSYRDIQRQIEALKIDAESIRKAEILEIIQGIRDQIRLYDLTHADIFPPGRELLEDVPAQRKYNPKYMHKETGKVWSGIGRRPSWLKSVANLDDFLIESTRAPNPSPSP